MEDVNQKKKEQINNKSNNLDRGIVKRKEEENK